MQFFYFTYYVGIMIVFLTHLFMLFQMPSMRTHAILNLLAAFMIAHYFVHREGYVKFMI